MKKLTLEEYDQLRTEIMKTNSQEKWVVWWGNKGLLLRDKTISPAIQLHHVLLALKKTIPEFDNIFLAMFLEKWILTRSLKTQNKEVKNFLFEVFCNKKRSNFYMYLGELVGEDPKEWTLNKGSRLN